MNIRNNKGITLMAEVLTIVVFLIIIAVISYSSMSSLQVRNLNNMYSDIMSIQEKAANYYLKYGKAPVTTEAVSSSVIADIASQRNPNDEDNQYYKVDFSVLTNMSLNNNQTSTDYYFMNTKTLTVYHSKGVVIDHLNNNTSSETYYTLLSNYEGVNKLQVNNYQD